MMLTTKQTGVAVLTMAVLSFFITISFTQRLIADNELLHQNCPLPAGICPFTGFPIQSAAAFLFDVALLALGLYMVYGQGARASYAVAKVSEDAIKSLGDDEKKLYKMVVAEGAVFQGDIVDKSGYSKVKVTRILDKLEGRGFVERRRRGLANMIVAKRPSQA